MANKTKKTNEVAKAAQVTETKTTKKVETKKTNVLDQAISKLSITTKATKAGSSIYKSEIFDGQDSKGKKAARRRARRIRDNFIGAWLESKSDKEAIKVIQNEWIEFATDIYRDPTVIFEKNTSEEDQKICKDFIKAMAIEY